MGSSKPEIMFRRSISKTSQRRTQSAYIISKTKGCYSSDVLIRVAMKLIYLDESELVAVFPILLSYFLASVEI